MLCEAFSAVEFLSAISAFEIMCNCFMPAEEDSAFELLATTFAFECMGEGAMFFERLLGFERPVALLAMEFVDQFFVLFSNHSCIEC
jgi:hypothetical protein